MGIEEILPIVKISANCWHKSTHLAHYQVQALIDDLIPYKCILKIQLWLLIYGDSDFMYDLCASWDQEFSHGKCVKEARRYTARLSPEQSSFSYDPQLASDSSRHSGPVTLTKWILGQSSSHSSLQILFQTSLHFSELLIFLLLPQSHLIFNLQRELIRGYLPASTKLTCAHFSSFLWLIKGQFFQLNSKSPLLRNSGINDRLNHLLSIFLYESVSWKVILLKYLLQKNK